MSVKNHHLKKIKKIKKFLITSWTKITSLPPNVFRNKIKIKMILKITH